MDPAARLDAALENARRFFVGQADVQQALRKLARLLDEEGIAYAVAGAMALNAYGYQRVTVDVDVLLTRAGLDAFRARHLGRGYVEKSHRLKDLADVLELIRAAGLPEDLAARLDESVRAKYAELWTAAQGPPAE